MAWYILPIVALLLAHSYSIFSMEEPLTEQQSYTLLLESIQDDNPNTAQQALARNANIISIPDDRAIMPFEYAIMLGSLSVLHILLDQQLEQHPLYTAISTSTAITAIASARSHQDKIKAIRTLFVLLERNAPLPEQELYLNSLTTIVAKALPNNLMRAIILNDQHALRTCLPASPSLLFRLKNELLVC